MPKQSILVVDDDREIVRLVRGYLEQAGYTVMAAYDGETALHYLRAEHPDLLLLDLMLPDRDGWDVTRIIRSDPGLADIPIIMLTARIDDVDKILGLELGADDYVTKPFNPREVVARVKALLRRVRREELGTTDVLQVAGLRMDIRRHEVTHQGDPIDLTVTEFNILRVLMENAGYALTRNELIEKGLGYVYKGMERTLDSHIKNLRQKLEDDPRQPRYIQTVYGVGYRLTEPQSREQE
ncbi:MAG: response regulator transcription factor [Anaerolineae bacterium]|nr:response regulator transcription factor [Anaerolineae bacterium]